MRRIVLLLGLLVGFVVSSITFAQDCANTKSYWEQVPKKRVYVGQDGRTYMDVFTYVPTEPFKLKRKCVWFICWCGKGCGLCAGEIKTYDITDGIENARLVKTAVVFPDSEGRPNLDGAYKNQFGEWQVDNYEVVTLPNGTLQIKPVQQ